MLLKTLVVVLVLYSAACRAQENDIPAEIVLHPEADITVNYNSGLTLTCVGYGSPLPAVTWFRDGVAITNSTENALIFDMALVQDNISFMHSILELCPLQLSGNYSCQASNINGTDTAEFQVTVVRADAMIFEFPGDTVANITDEVIFTCSARGVPVPTVTWYRNGIELDPGTVNITQTISGMEVRAVLFLGSLVLSDAGVYTCNASNPVSDTESRQFTFTLESPVSIVVFPSDSVVMMGDTLSLPCTASGIPPPQLTWLRRGAILSPETYNISVSTFSNATSHFTLSVLHLCDLSVSDSDIYSCRAESTLTRGQSTAMESFMVDVQAFPSISAGPVDQTVSQGSQVDLSCAATGSPVPNISWVFVSNEGVMENITADTPNVVFGMGGTGNTMTGTLRLSNISLSRAGEYQCQAVNSLGSDTARATITVFVAPVLVIVPEADVSIDVGGSGVMFCVARGMPLPEITWFQNGLEIQNNSMNFNIFTSVFNESEDMVQSLLEVCPVESDHAGTYACHALNPYGNQTSMFELTVNEGNATIISYPGNTVVDVRDTATLTCVARGVPLPDITWYRNGSQLDPSTFNITQTTNGTYSVQSDLFLENLGPFDAGIYSCNASHNISGSDGRSFTFDVQSAVRLIVTPGDANTTAGSSLAITCTASGIPRPTVTWSNGSDPLMDANITENVFSNSTLFYTVSILFLCDLQLQDSAQYTCLASNRLDEGTVNQSASFMLQVQTAPNISEAPSSLTVTEGDALMLRCTAMGVPVPLVDWVFVGEDGTEVVLTSNSTSVTTLTSITSNLSLSNLRLSGAGQYRCEANNSLGSDIAQANVTVFVPSTILLHPPLEDSSVMLGESFFLTCAATGYPLPSITWLRGGVVIESGGDFNVSQIEMQIGNITAVTSILDLCNAQLNHSGVYTCRAQNSLNTETIFTGNASRSLNFSVLSAPVFTTHPGPGMAELPAGTSTSRNCSATGNPRPVLTWERDGVEIRSGNIMTQVVGEFSVMSTLVIGPAVPESEGGYRCSSPDGNGSVVFSDTSNITFTSPPNLVREPLNVAIFFSMRVTFVCEFEGVPLPTVQWYSTNTTTPMMLQSDRTNHIINTTTTGNGTRISQLELIAPTETSAGTYTCSASNNISTNVIGARTSGSAQLFFRTDDPFLVVEPSNRIAIRGEDVTLDCEAGSNTTLTLNWTRNGRDFPFDMPTQREENVYVRDLVFTDVTDANSGMYVCTAHSAMFMRGVTSRPANLTIFTPLTVIEGPVNTTLNVTDAITFICVVEGSHDVTLTWMNGSSPVVAAPSRVVVTRTMINTTFHRLNLTIQGAEVTDAALYSCNATNVLQLNTSFSSSASHQFSLVVQRRPRIVPVNGSRPVAVNGSDTTLLFTIVEDIPLVLDGNISSSFLIYNGGSPGSSMFSFTKSGSELRINISAVDIYSDEGNYTVSAFNPAGFFQTSIYLDVQSPPVMLGLEVSGDVVFRRMNYVAVEGRRVVFTCSFLADPQPRVIWLQDNMTLDTDNTMVYRVDKIYDGAVPIGNYTETLTILSVVEGDQRNYTCRGVNDHSDPLQPVMATQPLEITVPPTVTPLDREPIGVETRDGRPSHITVGFKITRDDPPVAVENITWLYIPSENSSFSLDTTELAMMSNKFSFSSDMRELTIFNLSFFDRGNFTLTASNEAGTANATLDLIIHVEPNVLNFTTNFNLTSNLTGSLVEKQTAIFTCFADGYPLPRIVWLHNGSFVLANAVTRQRVIRSTNVQTSPDRDYISAHEGVLTVPRLRLRDAGEYICRADPANIDRGTSDFPESVELTVRPEPIDYCNPNPCKNSGICSNLSTTYLCTCVPVDMWRGVNCTIEIFDFDEADIETDPELDEFPNLFVSVELTCGAVGIPEPNITWFKDNKVLEGERARVLVIEEVQLADRGRYYCKAENFNPNNIREEFEDESEDVVVNINGIAQYNGSISFMNPRRRRRQAEDNMMAFNTFVNRLSGIQLDENSTIFSVANTSDLEEANSAILITLLAENGGSSQLTEALSARVDTVADTIERLSVLSLQRFDGCPAEKTVLEALEPGGLEVIVAWPEADLGENVTVQCPCGNLSALSGGADNFMRTASRVCGGNFTAGAVWEEAMVQACNFSIITRQLCQIASIIEMPEEAITQLENITRDEGDIGVDEFSVTTILIEAVSDNVNDLNLTTGLFEVVDNLLDVDEDSIQASQAESNTTARILNVVEDVAQALPIPENETTATIQLESFAVAVAEIRTGGFEGQVFSVDLGDGLEDESPTLGDNDVSFEKKPTEQPTASLSIDMGFFDDNSVMSAVDAVNGSTSATRRIINSVYLTDSLFPRINRSSNVSLTNGTVGSIILASTFSLSFMDGETLEVRVANINPPITLTFTKKQSLVNVNGTDTVTTCNFWDFELNEGLGDWSDMNCTLVNDTDTTATCECTHFTNFAILLDPRPVPTVAPEGLDDFLSAFSYIGVIVSIICLTLTVITYLASKKLRNAEAGQLLLNLCFGLLGIYVLFIICLHVTYQQYVCAIAGALLHYFLLATFFLMAAEAINLFVKLVIVLGIPPIIKNRFVLKAGLISWITPAVIVIISIAPDYTNYVRPGLFCRPYSYPFDIAVIVPFGLVYILNWILFIIIFVSLCRKKDIKGMGGGDKSGEVRKKLKQQFIIAATLSVLFGLGWGVGLAATTSITVLPISVILQILFILLVGFQGLFIFIMQCYRSEDARQVWARWATAITCNKIKFEGKKKKYNVPSVTSKGGTASSNPYGTLSTSMNINSDTMRKAVKKDLESSTFEESTFGASTFVSTAMEPVEEEKRDLSLDKDKKARLSRVESGESPPHEEEEDEGDTTALTSPTTLQTPSTFAPAPLVIDNTSAAPVVKADGSHLPEVPISPTSREIMELALLNPPATGAEESSFPTNYDIVMVNEDAVQKSAPAQSDGSKAQEVIQMVDDILNETSFNN